MVVRKAASESRLLKNELCKRANFIEDIFLWVERGDALDKFETSPMFNNASSKYEYTVDSRRNLEVN